MNFNTCRSSCCTYTLNETITWTSQPLWRSRIHQHPVPKRRLIGLIQSCERPFQWLNRRSWLRVALFQIPKPTYIWQTLRTKKSASGASHLHVRSSPNAHLVAILLQFDKETPFHSPYRGFWMLFAGQRSCFCMGKKKTIRENDRYDS